MYRAAFPGASDQDEKKETLWVKDNHELLGNNGSAKEPHIIRLAGTWVDPDLATQFADTYALGDIIALMTKAEPDPTVTYRKSSKAATPKAKDASAPMGLPTPSPTLAPPSVAKRRKESPAPVVKAVSPPPRRSTRVRSPAPAPMPQTFSSLGSPKQSAKKTRRAVALSIGGSDETVVGDDDAEIVAMAGPDMSQDIAEQQELINNLKSQRANAGENAGDQDTKSKRAREDEDVPLQFEFKEPEIGERVVVTNRRVWMEPRTKSLAWGVAAFAIGMGAV